MTNPTGLAKVTVSAAQRRIDVALPEHAPLAELLPQLLRHAGIGLADDGQAHGGWVLRRSDGAPLSGGAGLLAQGIRDGDVLYLRPGHGPWPELEYDDVVDEIAAGARRHGRPWDPSATRAASLAVAVVALLLGAVALLRAPHPDTLPGLVGLIAAALLTLGGVIASRACSDPDAGTALAALALPYAFVGGLLVLSPGPAADRAPRLLVGSVAVLLVATLGAVGVGARLRIFVGALTAGWFGVLGALLGYRLPAAGAAAIVLAVLVTGATAAPLLAIRLGNLPIPVPAPDPSELPDRARVQAGVVRTDEILTGLLFGLAVAGAVATVPVAGSGGPTGRLLVGVAATGLLIRGRLFPAVRQRLPLLLAGTGGLGALFVRLPATLAMVAASLVLAVGCVAAGAHYRRRAPGPYLGRAADLLDALCVVMVIPLACGVLGLFGAVRGLAG